MARLRPSPFRASLLGAVLLAVAACAPTPTPPGLSTEVSAAARTEGADSIALMRRQGELFSGRPFLPGNRVELLVDGPATFAAMTALITGARQRIDMESYEFDEEAGGRFAELLLAARARGVAVHLIFDGWGAITTRPALFERLRAGGVQVLEFNPIVPNSRVPVDINRRDHRKLLCVDGRSCITGGVNISGVYHNAPAPNGTDPDEQAWRDTDVRVDGPAVAQFAQFFAETWSEQRGPALPPPLPPPPPAGDTLVQAIDGAPGDGQPLIYRTLLASIALAKRSVHLTTGFFVPTPDMAEALMAAARRGVDVQVVVPSLSDSQSAVWAGRAGYGPLLEAGVRIHERHGRVLHAKTAVIDGAWSAVGSSNLDWRSAIWNNEVDAIVLGREFGEQMERLFRVDVAGSHSIDLAAWRRRGPVQRFQELRATMLSRLL